MSKKKSLPYGDCHKIIDGVDHKLCSICGNWFPCNTEYFYKNKKNSIDGYYPYCKKCTIAKSRTWMDDNPERFDYHQKKKNFNIPQNRIEYKREAAKRNRINGDQKMWRQNNKDKIKEYSKNRIRKKHDISIEEWDACRLFFEYRCAYCDMTWEENFEQHRKDLCKDHYANEGANDITNCVPCCVSCNSKKWKFEAEKWYSDMPFYNIHNHNKIISWLKIECKNK